MEALNLTGRKGVVVGIANEHSLAWSAAQHFHKAGADLAITYLNDKAKPFVEPLAQQLSAPIFLPCNVSESGQIEAVFQAIKQRWGRLDFVFHAIAWARKEDLQGRLTDCSAEGFAESMLISCHSFIRMAKLAEPLLDNGGSLMTLSYYGAEKVVDHYNVMGPVKAALEASVRYLAVDLGPAAIRVNAISAGPIRTLAGAGISDARQMFAFQQRHSPLRRGVTLDEIGGAALYLLSDLSTGVTGDIHFVDSGYNIITMPHPAALKNGQESDSGNGEQAKDAAQ